MTEALAPGAVVLRAFALHEVNELVLGIEQVIARAPLRHMVTPGGFRMSVATTSCGALGWLSDRAGYRYGESDPASDRFHLRIPSADSGSAPNDSQCQRQPPRA